MHRRRYLYWLDEYCQGGGYQALQKALAAGPQAVIDEIKERAQAKLPLRDVYEHDSALFQAACRYFDSWKDAVDAAGVQLPKYETWPREKVIEQIQRLSVGMLMPR